ncbi:MAG: hypothetical protein WCT08_02085 [Patescibacteria group bacterium]
MTKENAALVPVDWSFPDFFLFPKIPVLLIRLEKEATDPNKPVASKFGFALETCFCMAIKPQAPLTKLGIFIKTGAAC